MIHLAAWSCGHKGCEAKAFGLGLPIGLRAIGWEVMVDQAGAFLIRCPLHYGDDEPGTAQENLEGAQTIARAYQKEILSEVDRWALQKRFPKSSRFLREL